MQIRKRDLSPALDAETYISSAGLYLRQPRVVDVEQDCRVHQPPAARCPGSAMSFPAIEVGLAGHFNLPLYVNASETLVL